MCVHKCRSRRGISEPQVQVVGQGVGRRGQAASVRLGEPDQAGVEGRRPAIQGPAAAVEAHLREHRYRRRDRDSVDAEPPPVQTEVVADADAERVGEGALYNHPARAHPRLVHGCPRLVPSLRHRFGRDAVRTQDRPGDRVRAAVRGHAGSVLQCREASGGGLRVWVADAARHHVWPGGRRLSLRVRLADHSVQDQPEHESAGGRGDHEQQQRRLDGPTPHVTQRERQTTRVRPMRCTSSLIWRCYIDNGYLFWRQAVRRWAARLADGEVLGSSRCDASLLPWLPSSASSATGCLPGLHNRRTFR